MTYEIRLRESGQVLSVGEFRAYVKERGRANGEDIGLPDFLSADMVESLGGDPVLASPAPNVGDFQSAVRDGVVLDALGNWVQAWQVIDWTAEQIESFIAAQTEQMVNAVDDLIAGIYAKPQRFIKEYEEREAQARDFIAREGQGEIPARIAGFAAASGLGALSAAVLTVTQADALRGALGQLADLRMRKYEIKRAATLAEKRIAYADITAKVNAIASAIA